MRARSFSHAGITVSDFNRAVRFYWDVFGCPLVGVADTPSDRVRSFFGVAADQPSCKIGWIRVPGGATLEIFEFQPQQAPGAVPWNRVGLTHISFNVRNTEKWHAYLVSKGVECLSRPERSPRGHTFFFAKDFDGNLIEIMDLGYMYHVLKWLGPLGGVLFRRGMYKRVLRGHRFSRFSRFSRCLERVMRPPVRHVIYLHGFVSSPGSSKAQMFGRELASRGVGYSCPDLNLPAFETLTVTRMLEQTREAIEAAGAGPTALIGSSLGGFVAVHAAVQPWAREVDRLILLAPAFDFGGDRPRQMPDRRIADWRATGRMRVMHFAYEEWREVGFELYEDASRYDAFALDDPVPTLIVQGRQDASVDPAGVEAWAAERPSVDLRLVDDEHQLAKSADYIWIESEKFLGLS